MSNLRKIKKNVEAYRINEFYRQMTPEQYREGIRSAVKNATETLAAEYDRNLKKIEEEANLRIKQSTHLAIDTISVELLYELGKQMDCFVDEPEYFDQKKDKIQDMYSNIMSSLEEYAACKKEKDARKMFEKKRKLVEKTFDVRF